MLRFRQYLKEVAFTYSSDEWEKNFSSLIPNALDVLEVTTKISDLNFLVTYLIYNSIFI